MMWLNVESVKDWSPLEKKLQKKSANHIWIGIIGDRQSRDTVIQKQK